MLALARALDSAAATAILRRRFSLPTPGGIDPETLS